MEEPKDYILEEQQDECAGMLLAAGCIYMLIGFGTGWAAHWIYTTLWS